MTTAFEKLYKLADDPKICACGRCSQEVISGNPETKYIKGHNPDGIETQFKTGITQPQEQIDKATASRMGITLEELIEWKKQKEEEFLKIRICECPDHEEFTTKYNARYITGHNRKKYPIINKVCKCPDNEVFTTKFPNQEFIYGHNAKGIVRTEEQNKRNSESKIGITRSEEERERNRQSTLRQWATTPNMKLPLSNGRGIPTQYHGVQMRSKFEARVAKKLDSYGVKWEYEPQRFNLGSTTYMPDFYLPEFDIWLEAKPSNDYEKFPKLYKVDLLRQTGKFVTIVTEKDLRTL